MQCFNLYTIEQTFIIIARKVILELRADDVGGYETSNNVLNFEGQLSVCGVTAIAEHEKIAHAITKVRQSGNGRF